MPSSILSLPPELLALIDRDLTLVDKLALRCTTRRFYYYLPSIEKSIHRKLTRCEQIRVMGILAFDRRRRLCALCKQWYPKRMFTDNVPFMMNATVKSKRIWTVGRRQSSTADAIDAPSGCCPWHGASLYKLVTQQNHPIIVLPNWCRTSEVICMHCGQWKSEHDCKCPVTATGENACGCGVREIKAYHRYGGSPCQNLLFIKNGDDEMEVREWYRLPNDGAVAMASKEKFEQDLDDEGLYWRNIPILIRD